MSAHEDVEKPDKLAMLTAESILQLIYGDDLTGCEVNPESIATLVGEAFKQRDKQSTELLNLYAKVAEAVHILSTPPDAAKVTNPDELRNLLTDRLEQYLKEYSEDI